MDRRPPQRSVRHLLALPAEETAKKKIMSLAALMVEIEIRRSEDDLL